MRKLAVLILLLALASQTRGQSAKEILTMTTAEFEAYAQTHTFCPEDLRCTWTGNQTWSGNNSHSGTETFTGAFSFLGSNGGTVSLNTLPSNTWTDSQTDGVLQSTVGSIPCNNWFHGNGGAPPGQGGFATEAICAAIIIPSTSTKQQGNAVAGYVENFGPSNQPVAGYFSGTAAANNTRAWGINPLCNILGGVTGYGCTVGEFDYDNNTGTDDTSATPSFLRAGIALISGGSNKPWYGMSIQASNNATNAWQYGLGILNYNTLGLQIGGSSPATGAGARGELIYASDSSNSTLAFQLVNNPATSTLFSITDTGSTSLTALTAIGTQSVSGCSLTNALGGAWAGSFKSGTAGTCTVTITPGITALNGFVCDPHDLTTPPDIISQTAYTTTTATISGTTASADLITWKCVAF